MQLRASGISPGRLSAAKQEAEVDLATPTDRATGPSDDQSITTQSVIVVSKEQISCDLLGEAVILDLKCGVYYGLDEVGARVWALIQAPQTITAVCDAVLEEYDVDRQRCESDLLILLRKLKAKNLIEITG